MIEHFGLHLRDSKYGYKFTRENYAVISAKNSFYPKVDQKPVQRKFHEEEQELYKRRFGFEAYTDDTYTIHTKEWCNWPYENCMENFDRNMQYFQGLDKGKFDESIDNFLAPNPEFVPVTDLNDYCGCACYYMIVLDDYCQIYIGTTGDITKRIREHWNRRKPFDRLLLPQGNTCSIISIDAFRALDTPRIFVECRDEVELYVNEDMYINQFPPEFCANRFSGGVVETPLLSDIKTR